MTTHFAAKLARPTAAPELVRVDVASSLTTAAPSLPAVTLASLAVHGLVGLALIGLPLTSSVTRELDATWVSFDFEAPAAAPEIAPEPEVIPEPVIAPEPVVHRERAPQPEPEPEIAPPPPETSVIAPPSLEEAFAEPAPLAASLVGTGPSAFAVQQGELGGDPNGQVGGHGTSLVSVRPAPQETGPSEADRRRARRGYVHAIEDLVRAHARYPRAAAREGLQGRVELGLRVSPEGRVLALRVATSSGSPILDDAALAAGREIDRVPAPPALAALCATDEIRVGVAYVVQ